MASVEKNSQTTIHPASTSTTRCHSSFCLVRSTTSSLSTRSSGVYCRICQDNKAQENLITPCNCMGTIAFIHPSCLEKWLSQSARKKCELCQFEFETIMTSKGFKEWLCADDITRNQRRYMFADSSCFMLLTPLGLVSCWLCIQGAQHYYTADDFWTGFSLIVLSAFLTILYVFWFGITIRYHYKTFRLWQRRHTDVRLVFSNDKTTSCNTSLLPLFKLRTHNRSNSDTAEEINVNCHNGHVNTGVDEESPSETRIVQFNSNVKPTRTNV